MLNLGNQPLLGQPRGLGLAKGPCEQPTVPLALAHLNNLLFLPPFFSSRLGRVTSNERDEPKSGCPSSPGSRGEECPLKVSKL